MIDEFSSANFFGIKGNVYVTPCAKTILPSITNKSLTQVAWDLGMVVERRDVAVEELATFNEVGQCGTAVVITPVSLIDDKERLAADNVAKSYQYPMECGARSRELYETLTGIQYGEIEDKHGWCTIL